MAKVDTTKIAGYDAMTAEQKLAALESYEVEDFDTAKVVSKITFDKTASELAETKRQLKAKLSEEEQKEAERAIQAKELEDRYKAVVAENEKNKVAAKFSTLGYDEKTALETASAFIDGNVDVVFTNFQKTIETQKKAWEAARLDKQPDLPGGSKGEATVVTPEQFGKMGYGERLALKQKNPELYNNLTK